MKRFYLLLIVFICLPGLLMSQTSVGDEFTVDGIRYEVSGINKVQVTSGEDYIGEVTVPPEVAYQGVDYSVTGIGDGAFSDSDTLVRVNIPTSIVSIGKQAFKSCIALVEIDLPSSVTSIGDRAFNDCISLKSIYIPEFVSSIGVGALEICSDVFASSVRAALTIDVDTNNIAFMSEDNVVYNKQKTKLVFCSALNAGSFEIPETITEIGQEAFGLCMNLKSIDIPASVKSVGSFAFAACRGLNEIYVHSFTPPLLVAVEEFPGNSTFAFINISQCTLHVPAGSKSAYQAEEGWKDFNIVDMKTDSKLLTGVSDERSIMPLYIKLFNKSLQISNNETPVTLALFDLSGRLIYKSSISAYESITTPELLTGIYIVKASSSNGIYARKIVIQ
ncbi:leucine-rich repeat domain-containing protein [Maribellus mangrovi]|uniref:leucine-rich repeat domain-containing protein n=1 Tax=Maribellus mangrovi TaxID=3133146 RepID=UPI0030EC16FD